MVWQSPRGNRVVTQEVNKCSWQILTVSDHPPSERYILLQNEIFTYIASQSIRLLLLSELISVFIYSKAVFDLPECICGAIAIKCKHKKAICVGLFFFQLVFYFFQYKEVKKFCPERKRQHFVWVLRLSVTYDLDLNIK